MEVTVLRCLQSALGFSTLFGAQKTRLLKTRDRWMECLISVAPLRRTKILEREKEMAMRERIRVKERGMGGKGQRNTGTIGGRNRWKDEKGHGFGGEMTGLYQGYEDHTFGVLWDENTPDFFLVITIIYLFFYYYFKNIIMLQVTTHY